MKTAHHLAVAVWVCALSCNPRSGIAPTHARISVTISTRPEVRAETFLPTPGAPVANAAAPVTHPNEGLDEEILGRRRAVRPLNLPSVNTGQTTRFTFDGRRRGWVARLANHSLLATPAYSQGKVYVGAGFTSTTVYALDGETGRVSWSATTPDGGPTAAIVDDDKVLFNTESCTLFAFDTRTGRERWHRWLGDPLMSQAVSFGGRVFSAHPDEHHGGFAMTALSLRSGSPLWTRPITADVLTAPVIANGSLFATTMDGKVYRFRPESGRLLWSRSLNATSAPAVDGSRVYVAQRVSGGRERQLVLDADTGRSLHEGEETSAPYAANRANTGGVEAGWSYEGSRPTYAQGRLYYAMGNQIVARDPNTGRTLWTRRYPGAIRARGVTSPALAGSTIVLGTHDGDLFGLDVDTGATVWGYHVGEPIAFQPIVANGWVYASTSQGKVLGLEIGDRSVDGWRMWGGNAQHNGDGTDVPSTESNNSPTEERPSRGTLRTATGEHTEFPLLDSAFRVSVQGPVARITLEQSFSNPNAQPIDAEYLFPLPTTAAVDAFEMRVGNRVIRGEIQERNQARTAFRQARARGRTAALLEQERPNLFRQAVANVQPGTTLRVQLQFALTVPFRDGNYELALPFSAGSRFTPGQGGQTIERPEGTISVAAQLDVGVPLEQVTSPSHTVQVTNSDQQQVSVALPQGSSHANRDFVLRYRPRVQVLAPALVAAHNNNEGFFSLVLHPQTTVTDAQLTPRELVFLVDTSSSMRGTALTQAKALVLHALQHLRPNDTYRVLRFSDEVSSLNAEALAPTPANLTATREQVLALRAGGTTEMQAGLRAALAGPTTSERLRLIVLLTDGYIGNEREVLASVASSLGNSRLFAFGVGASVNRYLLEELADTGRGLLQVVLPGETAEQAALQFYRKIDRPLLTDVTIDWGGLPVREVYPRRVPDVFAQEPVVLHARYDREATGTITLRGRFQGRPWSTTLAAALPANTQQHEAIPSLWARARIQELSRAMILGETPALRDEVRSLGMRFHLVTDYTSFLAIDEESGPESQTSRIPPAGNSGTTWGAAGLSAVGSAYGSGYGGGVAGLGGLTSSSFSSIGMSDRAMAAPGASGAPLIERSVRGNASLPAGGEGGSGMSAASSVASVIRSRLGTIRSMYERTLRSNPTRGGRVVLDITINAAGRVTEVHVTGALEVFGGSGTELEQRIRTWIFPAGDDDRHFMIPIVLSPGD